MENQSAWQKHKSKIIMGGILVLFAVIYIPMHISYNNYANRTEVMAERKRKSMQSRLR